MKEQLKVNEEINENLDVLFEKLEEKNEFAMRAPRCVVYDDTETQEELQQMAKEAEERRAAQRSGSEC